MPGDARHNAVVVEVKAAQRWSHRGVVEDLETLSTFLSVPNRCYKRGLLLVFGRTDQELLRDRVVRAVDAANADREALQRVQLWWHAEALKPPEDLGSVA